MRCTALTRLFRQRLEVDTAEDVPGRESVTERPIEGSAQAGKPGNTVSEVAGSRSGVTTAVFIVNDELICKSDKMPRCDQSLQIVMIVVL